MNCCVWLLQRRYMLIVHRWKILTVMMMMYELKASGNAADQRKQEETSVALDVARSREVTEWQQRMGTVYERDNHILKDGTWSDLTITVGEYGTEHSFQVFQAHRLHVAKMSSVLANMVYLEDNLFDEQTCIHLPDLTPEVFSSLLDFMYSIKPTLHSNAHAKALLKAIAKYQLPKCTKHHCQEYIKENSMLLNEAEESEAHGTKVDVKYMLDTEKWVDCTFRVGKGENSKVFNAHRLVLAKTSPVFATMLFGHWAKQEEIKITDVTVEAFTSFLREIFLFQYCVDWVKAQLASQGKVCSPENMDTCLEDIVLHIRFTTMALEEFTEGPAKMELFSKEQTMNIQECIKNLEKSWSISPYQRDRKLNQVGIYMYGCCREDINFLGMKTKNNTYTALVSSKDLFYNKESAEYNFWIDKIEIPTQKKQENCTSVVYDEDASVYAYDKNSGEVLGIARFTGQVYYNRNIRIQFPRPIHSHSKDAVLTFVPHKSGLYPSKEYYKCGKIFVEMNGRNVPILSVIKIESYFLDPRMFVPNKKATKKLDLHCCQCERLEQQIAHRELHPLKCVARLTTMHSMLDADFLCLDEQGLRRLSIALDHYCRLE
ncbi:hypothetical protein B566_EDAN007400 [Ephemera danica]|nr:hypothetical protein B566_EDAN007400 [Ephemera danica]